MLPKISCLCVTNNRVELLKNSIRYFRSQSHQNKELVVVYLSTDRATCAFFESCRDSDIRPYEVPFREGITLGDMRNISIERAEGEYICVWDDDDWFHKDRLKIQFEAIVRSRKRASILSNLLIFDRLNNDAYLSHRRSWENSLLCEKRLLAEMSIAYPPLNRGEDSVFIEKIKKAKVPTVIHQTLDPRLYVYCYTGNNTYDANHFHGIFLWSHKLPDFHSSVIRQALSSELDAGQVAALIDSPEFSSALPMAIDQQDVSVDAVRPADAGVLANLMELNAHDLSPYSSAEMNASCSFVGGEPVIELPEPEGRFTFILRYRSKVVGFARASRRSSSSAGRDDFEVDDFFVLRRFRQLGIGRRGAQLLWGLLPGRWSLRVSDGNKPAIQFWRSTVAELSGGDFTETLCSGELRAHRRLSFDNGYPAASPGPSSSRDEISSTRPVTSNAALT